MSRTGKIFRPAVSGAEPGQGNGAVIGGDSRGTSLDSIDGSAEPGAVNGIGSPVLIHKDLSRAGPQRLSSRAQQISPPRVTGHKVDHLGGGEAGGSHPDHPRFPGPHDR